MKPVVTTANSKAAVSTQGGPTRRTRRIKGRRLGCILALRPGTKMEIPESCGSKRPYLDHVLSAPELSALCARLGFSPPIWYWTESFTSRIESCIDEASLEGEWSRRRGEADSSDGIALLTDPPAFQAVLDEAAGCFQRWAESARNRQEFDGVIQAMRNIRELVVERKPVRASMILDLTHRLWSGRNWEQLPEPLHERKHALDKVLQDIRRAIEHPKGLSGEDTALHSFAEAAQVYVASDWMHDRWLTTLLAREMLSKIRSSASKSANRALRWSIALSAVGCAVVLWAVVTRGSFAYLAAVPILVTGVGLGVTTIRVSYPQGELDRVIDEVQGGCFAGGVLAARLERLNSFVSYFWDFRLHVPSILVELLRIQRY